MIFRELTLSEMNPRIPEPATPCRIRAYLHEDSPEMAGHDARPVMIVVPGGAYRFTSDREADPIALEFLAEGYQVFLLRYSIEPARYPTALMELCGLIAHIRANAAEYRVNPAAIAVCGFSAGGHLTASSATLWKEPVVAETLGVSARMARPDAVILSYPVITSGEFAHRGSFEFLLGDLANDPEWLARLSLENRVDADTPPAFLWHTFHDELVPVENSLMMAMALRRAGVPFELHIFPDGLHGLSTADHRSQHDHLPHQIQPAAAQWMGLAKVWLKGLFGVGHAKE
ncbi:MAG: alpha/beta hydrolase [Ruminococcaceae bacterium]|nr:alpha/beta hydrolase [Oscillospiraceae bacterium]